MALCEDSQFSRAVERVLPAAKIRELSEETGVVRRRRKLDIVLFVRTLVLGFGVTGGRSLSGFRRLYQRLAGTTIARSSYHQRFTNEVVVLLRRLLDAALASARVTRHLSGAFDAFVEVLSIDSSIVRVSPELADDWPGAWANHSPAAVKVTAVTNVLGRDLRRLRLSPGSKHDVHLLEPGRWMTGRLLVFDLGFFGAKLFQEIDAAGGYFLSRLKKTSKPEVLSSYQYGDKRLVGLRLDEAQRRTRKQVIDAEAMLTYQDRPNKNRKFQVPFRVVALRDANSGTWHRYVTNAPPEMLSAKTCSAVYAARWEVELLFKELKSQYRMNEFRSDNGAVNLCLVVASLLALVVSRRLHRALARTLKDRAIPHDRWAKLFASVATDILRIVSHPRETGFLARELLRFLRTEAPDPNRNRALLAERSSDGVCAFG